MQGKRLPDRLVREVILMFEETKLSVHQMAKKLKVPERTIYYIKGEIAPLFCRRTKLPD